MKKLNKYIAILIIVIHEMLSKSFAALNFDSGMSMTNGGMSAPLPPAIQLSSPVGNIINFLLFPILICILIYKIFVSPYKFYTSYKKMNPEDKANIIFPLIIEKFISNSLIFASILFFIFSIFFGNFSYKNYGGNFYIPESFGVLLIYFIFIISFFSFLFKIIYGYLYKKKDIIKGKDIMKKSIKMFISLCLILIICFILIKSLGN